jgi:hypothetical protein
VQVNLRFSGEGEKKASREPEIDQQQSKLNLSLSALVLRFSAFAKIFSRNPSKEIMFSLSPKPLKALEALVWG